MRVGLDVDEVVAALHAVWLADYNAAHGTDYQHFTHWDMASTPEWYALLVPEIYDRVLPYPGAVEAVNQMRRLGHSIHYVTSSGKNNEHAVDKLRWLRRYGFLQPHEGWSNGHFIPGSDKTNAPVDVLIDDHIKNVESFNGWSILFNRPHNYNEKTTKLRVDSLWQFVGLLYEQRVA